MGCIQLEPGAGLKGGLVPPRPVANPAHQGHPVTPFRNFSQPGHFGDQQQLRSRITAVRRASGVWGPEEIKGLPHPGLC